MATANDRGWNDLRLTRQVLARLDEVMYLRDEDGAERA